MEGKEIGLLIKNKRESLGYTLQDIADKTGTSRQNIKRYESWDLIKPDFILLKNIVIFLNLDINIEDIFSKPFMVIQNGIPQSVNEPESTYLTGSDRKIMELQAKIIELQGKLLEAKESKQS